MKQRISSILIATSLSLLCSTGMAKKQPPKAPAKADEVVEVNANDPAMKAAVKKARDTFDQFLSVVSAKNPNIGDIAVRIVVREGKLQEYIWVTPFTILDDGSFKGSVNSKPTILKKVRLTQELPFQRADVVDWTYTDMTTGTRDMHGNFTTCAQLAKAPAADIKEMKRRYGLDCSAR